MKDGNYEHQTVTYSKVGNSYSKMHSVTERDAFKSKKHIWNTLCRIYAAKYLQKAASM